MPGKDATGLSNIHHVGKDVIAISLYLIIVFTTGMSVQSIRRRDAVGLHL